MWTCSVSVFEFGCQNHQNSPDYPSYAAIFDVNLCARCLCCHISSSKFIRITGIRHFRFLCSLIYKSLVISHMFDVRTQGPRSKRVFTLLFVPPSCSDAKKLLLKSRCHRTSMKQIGGLDLHLKERICGECHQNVSPVNGDG